MCQRATELEHHNYRPHVLQLLKPKCLEPVLNKRSHHSEKPHALQPETSPATKESPGAATKTPCNQKLNKLILKIAQTGGLRWLPSSCVLTGREKKRQKDLVFLLIRALIPGWGLHPHDLI